LIPAQAADAPAVVRFSYDAARPAADLPAPGPQPEGISYQLSGDKSLRPATISDDGAKTYITWDEEQAMPAVFAIGPSGKEEMVEGYMRRGVFTIDRVYAQLVFRIDQETAKAKRVNRRSRK
jgi:type IV secretion system protein VirB9